MNDKLRTRIIKAAEALVKHGKGRPADQARYGYELSYYDDHICDIIEACKSPSNRSLKW